MKKYVMAWDAGTTSARCHLFDREGKIVSTASNEIRLFFPEDGWVEADPMDLWSSSLSAAVEAMAKIGTTSEEIAAIGITNQRETVMLWDRESGAPLGNAIVWQCRRTADVCRKLQEEGYGDMIREKTGLLTDPYFSATKLRWLLDHTPNARRMAAEGKLCAGTVDSFLLYRLTGGRTHATDVSNASRTMLFNIHERKWDGELLRLFDVPEEILPVVLPSSGLFGVSDATVLGGEVPVTGVAGDQMAALFGQGCFHPGMVKNTYGTGGFLLMNTGMTPVSSKNGLLTTVAWQIGDRMEYALEGSVFVSGAAVQWLRDGLRVLDSAGDSEYMAKKVEDSGGVYLIPAFAGLGAPYWDPYARGMIIGITRATTKYHLIRATLDAMAYQTADLLDCMTEACGTRVSSLRVDGGAAENGLLLGIQADVLGMPVERPSCTETTARGAAFLAGLACGFWKDMRELETLASRTETFLPQKDDAWRTEHRAEWRRAVERACGWKNA